MNVSLLNSAKKKRRSSSVSSRRFHIVNKQAKLIISRKCHRVDLLDRNRHLNDHSVNNPNDISTTEEMDVNSIKTEKQDVPNQLPNSSESLQMSESTVTESNLSQATTIKTMATTSRLNDLKTKFTNFKNNLVKSISNIKKPPQSSSHNCKQEKATKHVPQTSKSNLHQLSANTSASRLATAATTTRKPAILPLNENLNLKTINEQHKRLQGNVMVRSSSVSTMKHECKPFATNNSSTSTSAAIKQLRKFDSTSTFTLSSTTSLLHNKSKENISSKPVFNQYSKITYNDKHLFQHKSPIYKKMELRRILAHRIISSSQTKLEVE